MAFVFVIPGPLRQFSAQRDEVRTSGEAVTVGQALGLLWRECPGVRDRVLTERGDVRTHVNVFVDGENIRHSGGLDMPVHDGAEIVIVPAVSGGERKGRPDFEVGRTGRPDLEVGREHKRRPDLQVGREEPVQRCSWARTPLSIPYHDDEWGVPVHDDIVFFEFVTLEGAQAGLSWETILRKREAYREAFAGFDPVRVARFTPARVEQLLKNEGIVRNRLKVESTVRNAKAFLAVQDEFGSFDAYVWRFVNGAPIIHRHTHGRIPATTAESDALSRDLLKRGFRFVGSTICYAFMQATGLVDDHAVNCFRYAKTAETARARVR